MRLMILNEDACWLLALQGLLSKTIVWVPIAVRSCCEQYSMINLLLQAELLGYSSSQDTSFAWRVWNNLKAVPNSPFLGAAGSASVPAAASREESVRESVRGSPATSPALEVVSTQPEVATP